MIFNILPEFAVAAILLAVGWFVGTRSQKQRDDDRCHYCRMLEKARTDDLP